MKKHYNTSGLNTIAIVISLLAINITIITTSLKNKDIDAPSFLEKLRTLSELQQYFIGGIFALIFCVILFIIAYLIDDLFRDNKKFGRKRGRY